MRWANSRVFSSNIQTVETRLWSI